MTVCSAWLWTDACLLGVELELAWAVEAVVAAAAVVPTGRGLTTLMEGRLGEDPS